MGYGVAGASVLVLGGTGSLGRHFVSRLLSLGARRITVFSRDEQKQANLRWVFQDQERLQFIIGDIREPVRLGEALRGSDIVINAAALKHIPSCEAAPTEAVLTNVQGAINLRREALRAGVAAVISISTDKAVHPVNVLGMTKALQERILLAPVDNTMSTTFACVRYGNVIGSRGSVVPTFLKSISDHRPLPVTHPDMTRFLLTLDEAVDLVLAALARARSGDIWTKPLPAALLSDIASALLHIKGESTDYPREIIGVRRGEKLHEDLLTSEEASYLRLEQGGYVCINAGYRPTDRRVVRLQDFSSRTARRLGVSELIPLLESNIEHVTVDHIA